MVAVNCSQPAIIERTEQAFEQFKAENAAVFASLRAAYPSMADTFTDFAKAAFLAGANYEYEHLSNRGQE